MKWGKKKEGKEGKGSSLLLQVTILWVLRCVLFTGKKKNLTEKIRERREGGDGVAK